MEVYTTHTPTNMENHYVYDSSWWRSYSVINLIVGPLLIVQSLELVAAISAGLQLFLTAFANWVNMMAEQ